MKKRTIGRSRRNTEESIERVAKAIDLSDLDSMKIIWAADANSVIASTILEN